MCHKHPENIASIEISHFVSESRREIKAWMQNGKPSVSEIHYDRYESNKRKPIKGSELTNPNQ